MTLDLRGLHCPLPILRAKKALRALPAGGALEVFADDPLSPVDFEAFCQASGDTLVENVESDGVFRFLIRRAG
ncbi:MAG: sulfurtransferase TusA family protein [Roseiarcus sp.]